MKLYDLKIANKDIYGKVHWRTIGTVFASDDGGLIRCSDTKKDREGNPAIVPVGFVIDYPQCNGIIVPRPAKQKEADENSQPLDEFLEAAKP
jgi:hypothetical protein